MSVLSGAVTPGGAAGGGPQSPVLYPQLPLSSCPLSPKSPLHPRQPHACSSSSVLPQAVMALAFCCCPASTPLLSTSRLLSPFLSFLHLSL